MPLTWLESHMASLKGLKHFNECIQSMLVSLWTWCWYVNRKDEKKNPWSAWEGADDADNGWNGKQSNTFSLSPLPYSEHAVIKLYVVMGLSESKINKWTQCLQDTEWHFCIIWAAGEEIMVCASFLITLFFYLNTGWFYVCSTCRHVAALSLIPKMGKNQCVLQMQVAWLPAWCNVCPGFQSCWDTIPKASFGNVCLCCFFKLVAVSTVMGEALTLLCSG